MLRKLAQRGQNAVRRAMMRVFSLVPMRDAAVFMSFSGKAYSDNPKAVSEALHAIRPEMEIVWLMQDPEKKAGVTPDYVRRVRIHSSEALRAMATAKAWVFNAPVHEYAIKRRGTVYVQTWHGDRGFKKMLYDAPDHPQDRELYEKDICDAMCAGSTFCEGTYRTGFRYQGVLLRFGSPRNDALMRTDPAKVASVKAALGISAGSRVLLYAPTMRNSSRRAGVAQPIQPIDIPRTLDLLGPEWVCAVRAHSTQIGLSGLPDDARIVDASGYEDMADLLVMADLLITDYSSSAGDFALTGRPIVLFQEDRAAFEQAERTFYFEIEQSPYVVVTSQAELEGHLMRVTAEKAEENDRAVLAFYGAYETGRASAEVAAWIVERIGAVRERK